jgi:hypothetical protein
MNNVLRAAACLIAAGCLSLPLFGSVVIQQEGGPAGSPQKTKTTMYVDAGKIRVEVDTEGRGKSVMIFDGDKQVLWIVQPEQGTYMEMTAETIGRLSQPPAQGNPQMEQAMKQMQERMASMSPEQRAMVEQSMKGRMGAMGGGAAAAPPRTVTFEAKGGVDKFGSFTCSKYDELNNGKRTAEICAAALDQLHLSEADIKSFRSLAKFFEPLQRMNPNRSYTAFPSEQLKGFPVHSVTYEGDKPTSESSVLSAEQKAIDGSMFTLPAGLKKSDFMGGRGGPPR